MLHPETDFVFWGMFTRMAPTPSGYLHLGNLYNFILAWLWARSENGRVLLRIDDADQGRFRLEYLDDIFFWLDELGLDWDAGPSGPDDFLQNWSQQKRRDLYGQALNCLWDAGVLYACTCSRTQLVCHCRESGYDRHKPDAAWKIFIQRQTLVHVPDVLKTWPPVPVEDFTVQRKDGLPAYPLVSVTDDRHFGITHIVRGEDLLESTAQQILLTELIWPANPGKYVYRHHPLLLSGSGVKLSKSSGHLSDSLRKSINVNTVPGLFAQWMGWKAKTGINLRELLEMATINKGF